MACSLSQSGDPAKRARAIVQAVRPEPILVSVIDTETSSRSHISITRKFLRRYGPELLCIRLVRRATLNVKQISENLGAPMVGLTM